MRTPHHKIITLRGYFFNELSRPIIEEIVRDYLGSDNYELEPIDEEEVMMVMD